ncbi:MAG: aspartate carbamoyltransferase [Candidatus Fischerbacteria bacterium RBG_13_37_8]|uniref:Aspartate carbamoyltransferase n=1 Tax=Candidatus Fischerbacteria bacterium RBG_13_37_8 TaxID=1817863 RepID=A0A1F5VQB3_9BACT|nr:MAG: aspartate carbamoyltransferase [Candidatus Fischerbacteria bacterium RBG_13_37_8]
MSLTSLRTKDLLGIDHLSKEEIELILDTADSMREINTRDIKKVPTLRGKTVVNLFLEPSTRTRTSFEIAARRLSADTLSIAAATSSLSKGETLVDMIKNIEAMAPDAIVIRHSSSGVPHMLSKHTKASVINAGDGAHEHPTQALLDALTIKDHKGTLQNLKVAIIGDILFSRVARSNIHLLHKMGSTIYVCAPSTLLPPHIDQLPITFTYNIKEAIEKSDVIMMLRLQLERHLHTSFPSIREYFKLFGLDAEKLKAAKKDVLIMHPGPINRGVEISSEVADGPSSVILQQVSNGVAVRMALLYLLIGGKRSETID